MLRVPLAPDHGSEALRPDSAEWASRLTRRAAIGIAIGAVAVDGVAQVVRLPSSPLLVVVDVGTRVDWLAVGGDHVALWEWLIRGVCDGGPLLLRRRWGVDDGALASASSG